MAVKYGSKLFRSTTHLGFWPKFAGIYLLIGQKGECQTKKKEKGEEMGPKGLLAREEPPPVSEPRNKLREGTKKTP